MEIASLRREYHKNVCDKILRVSHDSRQGIDYPSFADGGNRSSVQIAWGVAKRIGCEVNREPVREQTVGEQFELATKRFLEESFQLLCHLRPGKWLYSTTQTAISGFEQYEHLAYLARIVDRDKTLKTALGGDYIVKPDIVIARAPLSDKDVNAGKRLISKRDKVARLTPLRQGNRDSPLPILHASISCKWTIRSDRSQNTRTEALNLIRNRKGHLPHVVAVTAEPLPTRIAALALGTGDMDCVYHFALQELLEAVQEASNEDQLDMLKVMVDGRRLRDIGDLPFDLAV